MTRLTCPDPSNINPLSPNGFMFQIEKLPELTYFCQQAQIPSISLPDANQATPMVVVGHKGEQLQYDNLTIEFLIDSELTNYKALYNWMTDGFPDLPNSMSEYKLHSDGFLHVLNSSNNVIQTVQFVDLLPISIGSLQFTSTSTDVNYLTGTATFQYTYYKFT